jgi:hypothetical protein
MPRHRLPARVYRPYRTPQFSSVSLQVRFSLHFNRHLRQPARVRSRGMVFPRRAHDERR